MILFTINALIEDKDKEEFHITLEDMVNTSIGSIK